MVNAPHIAEVATENQEPNQREVCSSLIRKPRPFSFVFSDLFSSFSFPLPLSFSLPLPLHLFFLFLFVLFLFLFPFLPLRPLSFPFPLLPPSRPLPFPLRPLPFPFPSPRFNAFLLSLKLQSLSIFLLALRPHIQRLAAVQSPLSLH